MRLASWIAQYDLRREGWRAAAALAGLGLLFSPAPAQVVVFDPANFSQNILTATNSATQIVRLVEQIAWMRRQLEQLQREYEAITGARGMEQVARGPIEGELRTWLPGNYRSVVDAYLSGGQLTGTLAPRINQLRGAYPPLRPNEFLLQAGRGPEMVAHAQHAGNVQVVSAASERVMDDLGVFSRRLDTLTDKIDDAQDLKAAMDLNNRLLAENNYLTAYSLRLQALDMGQQSAQDQEALTRVARMHRQLQQRRHDVASSF